MVHLKRIPIPSNVSVVMASVDELTPSNCSEPMHTQGSRPRVRLRKVVSKKTADLSKIGSDTQTICDVKVEDYKITKDGRVIDGTSEKPSKHREHRVARKSSYTSHQNNNNSINYNQCNELKPYYSDSDQKAIVREVCLASGSGSISSKDGDTYDYFGKYVASLLRNMEAPEAITLQGDIVNMIVEAHTRRPEDEDLYYG